MAVENIQIESGYLVVTKSEGAPKRIPVIKLLGGEVADYPSGTKVPDLTISSLTLLTTLAQLVWVLVRTLEEQGIINEELVEGFDLQYLLDTLKDDLDVEEV